MAAKDKEREFLIECIHLYRKLPALWNIKSKLYHNRERKNMAYSFLLGKYREMYPDATKEDVKKKINSLRTNYRKELKKYVNSVRNAVETETSSLYEPTLWYYDEMKFLQDQELHLESKSSIAVENNSKMNSEDSDEDTIESRESVSEVNENSTRKETTKATNTKKRSRIERQVTNTGYEHPGERNDEYYHWGMVCAADLKKMQKSQQMYAKKAIADIIMEGQLGLLQRNSVKINESTKVLKVES